MDKYQKLASIGEGTYAKVYRAKNLRTGELVALKEINLSVDEGAPSTALREIAFMKELKHPNIVRLLEVVHTEDQLVLVFECMECDLKQFLDARRQARQPLSASEVRRLVRQLLEGTRYCHEQRILHRDLKPQNLLLDAHGTLKIADFGLARTYGIPVASFSHEVVTLWYRPPDVLLENRHYNTTIDMWSVGCIMGELHMCGQPMFPGKNAQDQVRRIFKLLGTPGRDAWPHILPHAGTDAARQPPDWLCEMSVYPGQSLAAIFPTMEPSAIDLLGRMLDYRPSHRISAEDALEHPYFASSVSGAREFVPSAQ